MKKFNIHEVSYLDNTAVKIFATDPVYSFTILSKYLRIEATTMPPNEANKTAITKIIKIVESVFFKSSMRIGMV